MCLCLQDGVAMLWDLAEGKRLYSLDAGDVIHALCFSPNRYWLCAATQACIKVPSCSSLDCVACSHKATNGCGHLAALLHVCFTCSDNTLSVHAIAYTAYAELQSAYGFFGLCCYSYVMLMSRGPCNKHVLALVHNPDYQ